jgi:hypothetical protein
MNRITITLDEDGYFARICADEAVEVLIICPGSPRDRNYRWSSLEVGRSQVDEEIGGWPISDKDTVPSLN